MPEQPPQDAQKKIVLKAAGGAARPSDQTHNAGALKLNDPLQGRQTDSKGMTRVAPGSLSDPMQIRVTETGSMQRMETAGPSVDDTDSRAKRTIKLKPIASKADDKEQTVALQRAKLTATIEGAPEVEIDSQEAPTVKIRKAGPLAGAPPPPTAAPGAKQTIKLRPSQEAPAAAGAPSAPEPSASPSAGTIKLKPVTGAPTAAPAAKPPTVAPVIAPPAAAKPSASPSKPTLKLKPLSAESAAAPAAPAPAAAASAAAVAAEATAKAQTMPVPKKPVTLTPSAAPAGAPEEPTVAVKKPITLSHAPAAPAAPTEEPTVAMKKPDMPAAPSAPTLKLSETRPPAPAAPSAPTLKLSESHAPAEHPAEEAASAKPAGSKSTLRLRAAKPSAEEGAPPNPDADLPPSLQAPPETEGKKKKIRAPLSSDPGPVFIATSFAAALLLACYLFIAFAQFGHLKMGMGIGLPGISGKLAPAPK